ncbi:hypothetical protein ACFO8O_02335 [Hephaestia sp. GCM10023244]|uniref:hypothetical protein n=1 Tax=unclassified Hephaestia TaxID=2631281 RepID=UPI0020777CF9|nr:hypothetical protein [Hephaestia sp. MAHUQ-44]MCM8729810.1 hypothetical protein [Hephaestia sp. MAHUQ-44]
MRDKIEFAGPEWHARLKALLERYTTLADPGLRLSICEVFTAVPPHLDADGTGRIAWHCRIADGTVAFHDGEIPTADLKTIADYDFVLRLARMKIEEATLADYRALQAEGAASGKLVSTGDPALVPAVFHGMHNDLAEITA